MASTGPLNSLSDIDGLRVGHASDPDILTGTSVIIFDQPATAAVQVAGGGPGTRETDLLKAGMLVQAVDAIVLSGGSSYGLAAAHGVTDALAAVGRGFALADVPGVPKSPIVPAAILYDLANGGNKAWGERSPYEALGRAAFEAASYAPTPLGAVGAGAGALAGARPGGLGSASIKTEAGLSIAALTAVNSFGSVTLPNTDVFWAWPYEIDGEFGGKRPELDWQMDAEDWGAAKFNPSPRENTTISCIVTENNLTPSQAQRVAQMALAGFARAIRPVFAPFDGDTVFVASTGKCPLPKPEAFAIAQLGELAANVLARSIARGAYEAGKTGAIV